VKVLLVGAGGHALVVADICRSQRRAGQDVEFVGYVDDRVAELRTSRGDDILGTIAEWPAVVHDVLIVSIGDNRLRRSLFETAAANGARFATAIHPAATIAQDACIGPGTMICAGVVIGTQASIGANIIVNTSASVDHHCRVADHAHIAPGVRLGGEVQVGEGALVGIGATVLPGKKIGEWATVGAGAVVIDNVSPGTTVVGVPARAVPALRR
jgi:acetyltransferase EpsM